MIAEEIIEHVYESRFAAPPDGWEPVRIADLVLKTKTQDPTREPEKQIKYIDVSSVSNTLFKISDYSVLRGADAPSRARKVVHKNDIIFATVRPTLKRIAIVGEEFENEYCSTGYCVLRANPKLADHRFLYYVLLTDDYIDSMARVQTGASYPAVRDSDVKNQFINLPPLPDQRAIARVLSIVQAAIAKQDEIIQTTQALKKALMHKLFTEGLNSEQTKDTEIGPVPESWEVVELGQCLDKAQYGLSVKGEPSGQYPILRMTNQEEGKTTATKLQHVNISEKEVEKFRLQSKDILFNRTNSIELVGKTSIFELEGDYVFASYLIRLQPNPERLDSDYLNFYLNHSATQDRLKTIANRGVSQANISASRLSGFTVPVPPLQEQIRIAETLEKVGSKVTHHQIRKRTLESLFRTLLHELMTGQRRVSTTAHETY